MAYTNNFYESNYSLMPPAYGSSPVGYQIPASQIGLATDSRTSNQIQEVQKKLRTGTKTIEISPSLEVYNFDSIPKDHFKEINRLKKLAGIDLTFHGPMVEPSGFNQRAGSWDESQRVQAENQLYQSIVRGHDLDPDGNLVITFHTSYGIPETNPKMKGKKEGEDLSLGVAYIDEDSGRVGFIKEEQMYLLGKKLEPDKIIENVNGRNWSGSLGVINNVLIRTKQYAGDIGDIGRDELKGLELYKNNPDAYKKFIEDIAKKSNDLANIANRKIERLAEAEIDIKDAYNRLNEQFNLAYKNAEKEKRTNDLDLLNRYKQDVQKTIEKNKDNPLMFLEFREQVSKGIQTLNRITPPLLFKPLRKFALEKGAETYANVAFKAYQKFGDTAPIISIENPPAGTAALSSGEDLKAMVKETRDRFVDLAISKGNMSKSQAKEQAEKLIGATWDVGHINMIRKYGYGDEDIIKETEKIAKFVNKVHLSDNFGMEHTELPMGMGNVPAKEMLAIISKYNDKVKKISETGGAWYQFFKKEPLMEQFSNFNSQIYSAQGSPTWNDPKGMMGSYFSGIGNIFPDQHFSSYGAGFSALSPELQGQGQGGERSRFAGTPAE